ncbi:MAG: peptidase C39 family protein, partial [Nonomuraea sp.]|nr:peptidase C39 family protein [Nonomuraea sp.]
MAISVRQAAYHREQVTEQPFRPAGKWEVATWTGPMRTIGFAATEIVPSWTARTPEESWIKVELQVPGSRWYVLGRWSYAGPRTSVRGQSDRFGRVDVDVFKAARPVTAYRLRVGIYRAAGSAVRPEVVTLGAAASRPGRAPT